MKKYSQYISLGSSCCPGLTMRNLGIKSQTYPFDWVRVNNKIIYDILLNGKQKFLSFDSIDESFYMNEMYQSLFKNNTHGCLINNYGQYFTHYKNKSLNELKTTFSRYIDRFFDLLKSNQKVLFIQSHEDYILHKKSRDRRIEFYEYLIKINDLINNKYPDFNFDIINIDIDNQHKNYKNIINLNIKYNLQYSNEWEYHDQTVGNYRQQITNSVASFLDN
jgi:hypothetical protein